MRMPGFIGPTYTLSTIPLDCQRCINWYPEPDELTTGKDGSIGALVCTPGLTRLATASLAPIRGCYTVSANGTLYVVAGQYLYQVSSTWTLTQVGQLRTSTGAVSMSDNGLQLCVVDGLYGYILELDNNNFTQITSSAFYPSNVVVFLNGYFVFVKKGTGQFFWSQLYDGLTYDGLDFATAEASPDTTITLQPYKNQLFVLGDMTGQVFYNAGDPLSAFSALPGATIEHGCAAPLSVAKTGDLMFWLGKDAYGNAVVWKAADYAVGKASNYSVELAFQGYADISDATAFVYQQRGHTFYVLNFTSANATWVLDVDLGVWHERSSISDDGSLGRWRADSHTFAYGTHVVGDYSNGKLYKLDFSNFTDDGKVITRLRRAPHVSNNLKRMLHQKAQLDCRVGAGTDATQLGQVPQVMLRYSDDGGYKWSSEQWRPLGRLGETLARVLWRRLGNSRNRVYEIKVTDPVDVALIGLDLDLTPCES